MKHKNLIHFLTRQFPDEKTAQAYFVKQRWGNSPSCPYGCSGKVYNVSNKTQPFKCAVCRKLFSVKTGTIMENSPISVRTWLLAMWILGNLKKGISSYQLADMLGITQKTAWFVCHRIREACVDSGKLSGAVEMDATFVGGLEKNKHANKKHRKGGTHGKLPVVGMIERGGRVIAEAVDAEDKTVLFELAERHIEKGSTIYTDEHSGYKGLSKRGYSHFCVNHSKGEYVRGHVTTNTIESFFAAFKKAYKGTYTHLSKKHLQRYLDEFTTRFNFDNFLGQVCQKRASSLSYRLLTHGKKKETYTAHQGHDFQPNR
ncbi:IS1595 family transposase [Candidatus Saccharibacteria bacterium]|nr:IS1595 family transposase [Candidatus Saccharibacteria bacterium]